MGVDKAKAFAAAKKLNTLLVVGGDLVDKVVGAGKTVADAVAVFRADDMPGRGWAPKTTAWYAVFLRRIEEDLGSRPVEGLSVLDCATYIRETTESPRSRQTYRLVLGWVLACAVQEGWIDSNPAELTRKFSHTRKRQRLTLETFKAIHAKAPAWLKNAMDLSLLTLLRREDVASLRFADERDGHLYVVPAKTEGTTLVKLKIAVTPDLATLLKRGRDNVASPYVVHALPGRLLASQRRAKDRQHHTQLLPEQVTRAFADARDAAGLGGENAPTFHEVRSLGGALLRDQGWTLAQVQALMGHASEAMTKHYLEGHDAPWSEVTPGLRLPA